MVLSDLNFSPPLDEQDEEIDEQDEVILDEEMDEQIGKGYKSTHNSCTNNICLGTHNLHM
jgi:hypothetical protein